MLKHHITNLKPPQTGFLNMTMRSLYSNDLQSPYLKPTEQLWDVVGGESHIIDVQYLCDAIMAILTKISEVCLKHLVQSMTQIESTKGVQLGTSKIYLTKWPVSIYDQ